MFPLHLRLWVSLQTSLPQRQVKNLLWLENEVEGRGWRSKKRESQILDLLLNELINDHCCALERHGATSKQLCFRRQLQFLALPLASPVTPGKLQHTPTFIVAVLCLSSSLQNCMYNRKAAALCVGLASWSMPLKCGLTPLSLQAANSVEV